MKRFSGLTILIVEDHFVIAQSLGDLLRQAGARVIGPATHPREALSMIAQDPIDGALLDVELGDSGDVSNVSDVAEELARRAVPFIVVTGHDRRALTAALRDAPYLSKPYNGDKLFELIDQTFRTAARRD